MTDHSDDELEQQLAGVREQIKTARRDRLNRAAGLSRRRTLERAIEDAERDADALTSSEVAEARQRADTAVRGLRRCWTDADVIRLMVLRLEASAMPVDRLDHAAQLRATLAEEARQREASRSVLVEVGIGLDVPDPLSLRITPHPNSEELERVLADAQEDIRQRELRAQQPTRHRPPDRHAR